MTATVQASPTPENHRWIPWVLALTLAFCFGLRVWNASAGLDATRYFDERFSLRNVSTILVEGDSRPSNAFYGSLSYLPQTFVLYVSEKLHELTGIEWLSVFDERTGNGYSSTAYFLCRAVCALFGTLSVWLTFLVGRRLFSARVGLLGAVLYTAFPRHILSSTEFKPDILVVLLVLLAFDWSLNAAHNPSLKRILIAGAGVGLAVAAKYTGVGVAIPLTVGVLFYGWRDRKIWMWLVTAGIGSIITFILLNIHIAVIIEYLPRIWRIMETKGEATGGSHWTVLWLEVRYLLVHHGWFLFGCALIGCGRLIHVAFRQSTGRERRLEAVMVLSYIFGYSALYAAATKLFKGQNYLPVAAFTSLLAAWILVDVWDWLKTRLPLLERRLVVAPLVLLGLFLLFQGPVWMVYQDVVPTTFEQIRKAMQKELRPLHLRLTHYEREGQPADYYEKRKRVLRASTPGGHWAVNLPTESLTELSVEQLNLSDGEIFFTAGLDQEQASFYLQRATRPGVRSRRFEPKPFQAFGPAVVAAFHPWKLVEEPTLLALEPGAENRFTSIMPATTTEGEAVSLSLWLPLKTGPVKPRKIFLNGQELPLYRTRRGGSRAHFITPRLPLDPSIETLELRFDPGVKFTIPPEVRLCRWTPPG